MGVLTVAFFGIALICWAMSRSLNVERQVSKHYETPTFCVIPGQNEESFVYTYDLPTKSEQDRQFWDMCQFVHRQIRYKTSLEITG